MSTIRQKIKAVRENPKLPLIILMDKIAPVFSDRQLLRIMFRLRMGKSLNLKNPQTFQEKIQWLKLYDRNPKYTTMVDKYAAKEYVASVIGKEYIIPTIGIYDSVDEIPWDSLPDRFVLKCTHDSGGIVICKDKSTLDINKAKRKLTKGLSKSYFYQNREWPYKNVPRRIIAEKFIEIPDKEDLTDYKIFCFNGEPKYIQVIQDRNTKETIDFFDTDWNHQEFYGLNPIARPSSRAIARPANLSEMLEIARKLSKDIPFVRVDLYQTTEGVYFGETTFYPASGCGTFTPAEWNIRFGDLINTDCLQPAEVGNKNGGGKWLIYNNLKIYTPIDGDIKDYKFFCFNGEPKFLKVDFGRFTDHHANYYDIDWNLLPFGEVDFPPVGTHIENCPPNFDKMVEIARTLSRGHKFLRVDLYNIAGKIYFGELTFFPASGMGKFTSEEWEMKIGNLINL